MLYPSPSMCFIIEEEKERSTQGGILLEHGNKGKSSHGTIYSINASVACPHCTQYFDRKDLSVGDRVIYSRYVAEQIDHDGDGLKGKRLFAVPLDSVLAKIHD